MYYFEIQIVLPEEDTFKGRKLSKEELSEVTKYLEDKTSKGIPVKLRVGIFQKDEDIKIMSVTLSTKNTKETNIVHLLINRVTEPNILAFLSIDKQSNEKDEKKEIETNDNIVSPKKVEEVTYHKNQLSTKRNNKINFRTAILALIIVLLVGGNLIQQIKIRTLNSNIEHLENKINQVKEMDINQAKIDTFGRYFLTYYFAQNKTDENYQGDLRMYVSDKAHLNQWKVLNKELKSINYYGSESTGQSTYKVTYILNVLSNNHVELQKITFKVKEYSRGFSVMNKPQLTDFSFKYNN